MPARWTLQADRLASRGAVRAPGAKRAAARNTRIIEAAGCAILADAQLRTIGVAARWTSGTPHRRFCGHVANTAVEADALPNSAAEGTVPAWEARRCAKRRCEATCCAGLTRGGVGASLVGAHGTQTAERPPGRRGNRAWTARWTCTQAGLATRSAGAGQRTAGRAKRGRVRSRKAGSTLRGVRGITCRTRCARLAHLEVLHSRRRRVPSLLRGPNLQG